MTSEHFRPPLNYAPGNSLFGRMLFFLRRFGDLQIASIRQHLDGWLRNRQGQVLEIGCGDQPYRHLIPMNCEYCGLDWVHSKKIFGYGKPDTIYYDGEIFPFSDNKFDALFHSEVMEHVYAVETFLSECHRVLKPDGEIAITVPFQARYHFIPHDYWRFTAACLDKLLKEAGFEKIIIIPRGNDVSVMGYKVLSVIYRLLFGCWKEKLLGAVLMPLGLLALMIVHTSLLFPGLGSPDDCLGYVVFGRKKI
ncbi:MAG: class I SAM-dependent methyltransferase [Candidatus Riflebacteria bacterium]|nr:class I SAM-dependent methyltransferase [Candidatus Riflebacteria bacterium]